LLLVDEARVLHCVGDMSPTRLLVLPLASIDLELLLLAGGGAGKLLSSCRETKGGLARGDEVAAAEGPMYEE
jgi:hypothetical protein